MPGRTNTPQIDGCIQIIKETMMQKIIRWFLSPGGITITIFIICLILVTIHKGPYIFINTLITGGMWALMAVGVSLIFGVMNIANFAHGEFFMIGSLVAYFLMQPMMKYLQYHPNSFLIYIGPFLIVISGAVTGALLGVLVERVVFKQLRLRNRYNWLLNCFLVTIGLSIFLQNSHQLLFSANYKGITSYWSGTVKILDVIISIDRTVAFLMALVTMTALFLFMKYSKPGKAIRAVSQDEAGAKMVGVSVDNIQMLTFALSCGLAALAGASLLFMFPSYPTVGVVPLFNSYFIVILVGFGNVAGAIPGGFIIAFFNVLTRTYLGEGWELVLPVLLICLVLIVKPSGLFGAKVKTMLEI